MKNQPAVPEDARIEIRIDEPPNSDEAINPAELHTRRTERKKFARAFERFREKAELSDAQTQAVLLALYDFQEIERVANDQLRQARAWYGYADEDLERLNKQADRVFFDEREYVSTRLKTILSKKQYSVWQDEMMPTLPYILLEDYAPLRRM